MTSRCCCRENSSSEICWKVQRKASLQWILCCGPRSSTGAERKTERDIKCIRDEMIMISRFIHYSSLAEVVSTVAEEGLTTVGFLVSDTTVICVNPANRCLKPVLNWVNVCLPNILRTVRRTMIRFLTELLVRRTWFGQFDELYFVLNWLVMRCKLRPQLAADAQQIV